MDFTDLEECRLEAVTTARWRVLWILIRIVQFWVSLLVEYRCANSPSRSVGQEKDNDQMHGLDVPFKDPDGAFDCSQSQLHQECAAQRAIRRLLECLQVSGDARFDIRKRPVRQITSWLGGSTRLHKTATVTRVMPDTECSMADATAPIRIVS
jgi:hypothetical protein